MTLLIMAQITYKDVTSVAEQINFEPTEREVEEVLDRYNFEQESDPSATWNLVVEKILYDLKDLRNVNNKKS